MLDDLIRQIDDLPPDARRVLGNPRSGTEVIDALPSPEHVLAAIETRLKEAMLWQLTADGRMIVGDGCADPAPETRSKGYLRAKHAATAVAFQPNESALRVLTLPYLSAPLVMSRDSITLGVGEGRKVIDRANGRLLWLSRLATPGEYQAVNRGQFDRNVGKRGSEGAKAWLLGADDPFKAPLGWYDTTKSAVRIEEVHASKAQENRGARRVVEVPLYGLK